MEGWCILDNNIISQFENKMRIIQEMVPGKQVTIAHLIANPDEMLYKKIGLDIEGEKLKGAIGILTITPGETAIIASDIAIKAAGVDLGFIDRQSGTLIVTGTVSQVETALISVLDYSKNKMGFEVCDVTKT